MHVKHIPCGEYANQSEQNALEFLRQRLNSEAGSDTWFLLTNLLLSLGHESLPEEIDLLAVGPTGVFVVEVKHWDASLLKSTTAEAEKAAERTAMKAKKIAGKLKNVLSFDPGFVQPRLLFTRNDREKHSTPTRRTIEGVPVFGLAEWRELLDLSVLSSTTLTTEQSAQICQLLQPQAALSITGKVRHLMDFANMEKISEDPNGFCRVYRARRRPGMDRVIVHIYDLTAITPLYDLTSGQKTVDPRAIAQREYEVMQRLQKSPWLPHIFDSFQPVPGYPGELYYFSYADTSAVSLQERASDPTWDVSARLFTALQSVRALRDIHQNCDDQDGSMILHRNITPETIRVRSNNEPLLTGLHLARISSQGTISGMVAPEFEGRECYVAPEVRPVGLTGYTVEADIYALCASHRVLFERFLEDPKAQEAWQILNEGMAVDPAQRPDLTTLERKLEALSSGKPDVVSVPVACWDETTVLKFNNRYYRVLSRLGQGAFGTTFKVEEIDHPAERRQLSGPYVAKAITHAEAGRVAAEAYARVRAQTGGPHLAGVLEVAPEWQPDQITVLLKWVPGDPLADLRGLLPLYLEDQGEGSNVESVETQVLQWLYDLCEGLAHLHRAGLVHGDVSPK
ncbi:MAG: NERD domain-containing protein kinase family protein, partial [Chloroherpetonaceae bacterium]|nr:NERD domain-containing protein kinase family protein [Chloroherpetonaceae bacterium]